MALEIIEAESRARDPRRLRADRLRARARFLASTGDIGAAEELIGQAEALHRDMGDAWELARTMLVVGEIHRRARRRAMARAALREALETFVFLGAQLWARQAREQLARISGARPPGELTPTQHRVAELAARWPDEPAGRRSALDEPAHRRGPSQRCLPGRSGSARAPSCVAALATGSGSGAGFSRRIPGYSTVIDPSSWGISLFAR